MGFDFCAQKTMRLSPVGSFVAKTPFYAVRWVNDDLLLAAGGGGSAKSGLKNEIVRFPIIDRLLLSDTCLSIFFAQQKRVMSRRSRPSRVST
jgi:hypothetical protein